MFLRSSVTAGKVVQTVFEVYDGNSDPVTGLPRTDFVVLLSRNDKDDPTPVSISEIGGGRYGASFTPHLVGHWQLWIRHEAYSKRGWFEDFDVAAADTGEAGPGAQVIRRRAGLTDDEWIAVMMVIAEAA